MGSYLGLILLASLEYMHSTEFNFAYAEDYGHWSWVVVFGGSRDLGGGRKLNSRKWAD